LIKALAHSWGVFGEEHRALKLASLYEDFQAAGFEKDKADTFFLATVEGVLDHLQTTLTPHEVNRYRVLAKKHVNPDYKEEPLPEISEELGNMDWIDDDVSMGGMFDDAPMPEQSELHKELVEYVVKVEGVWGYMKPFFFRRSKQNPSTLFVVTSVGNDEESKSKVNVNVAIGSLKLPEIGEEHIFYENGAPVKYGHDGKDGRTYWGWAFKIKQGTTLRFWMSRVLSGNDVWEQRAKALIKLNPELPRGYHLTSAKHDDHEMRQSV
jgi:hypothetical protein